MVSARVLSYFALATIASIRSLLMSINHRWKQIHCPNPSPICNLGLFFCSIIHTQIWSHPSPLSNLTFSLPRATSFRLCCHHAHLKPRRAPPNQLHTSYLVVVHKLPYFGFDPAKSPVVNGALQSDRAPIRWRPTQRCFI